MRNHNLPPQETLERLEPYLYFTSTLIVGLGILGGWAGNAWPWVLAIYLARMFIPFALGRLKKTAANPTHFILLIAANNYLTTLAIILLTVPTPNPFWLLFLVETVTSAIYRALPGILFYSISEFLLLVFLQITYTLDRSGFVSGCIYTSLSFLVGITTHRGLTLLYEEHENRERVETEIRHSEQRLRHITDNMLDLIAQSDAQGYFIYTSPSIQMVLGYALEELQGRKIYELVHPQDLDRALRLSQEAFASASPVRLEIRLQHAGGHYIWMECIGKPILEEGHLVGIILSGRDISRRKRMEEKVNSSLKEKEVLLKEIHHRVKNNLQVISSLLNLQSQQIQDPAVSIAFRESQDRVRTMALIHEKLYQSDNLAEIEFSQYINNLSAYLVRSYQANSANIRLNIHCDPIFLDIDTSMPCGLILNELISNALKYAFPENRPGEIWIEMRTAENHQVNLVVADNGIGFDPNFDPLNASSLGLQLVTALVNQIGGELRFENCCGTRVEITFQPQHPQRDVQN
jgi:two-component system, sensor histidine kinase PdtaS